MPCDSYSVISSCACRPRASPDDQFTEFRQRVPVELAALHQRQQIAAFVACGAARIDDDALSASSPVRPFRGG